MMRQRRQNALYCHIIALEPRPPRLLAGDQSGNHKKFRNRTHDWYDCIHIIRVYIISATASCKKMTPIPDHPGGLRFCRQCSAFLPISQFHASMVRRFECKTHALERAGRYRKNSVPDANRRAVQRVWHALWADSRIVFGRKNAGLTQADVRHLFGQKGMEPDLNWRVVPKDLDAEWGLKNAEIVPKNVRNTLVSAFLKRSREGESL
jgi:hypothetical protein